ncbi:MAG: hypothetical protein II319_08025 [Clostridia bacterium]|nr:hypothetical protein [Clostridia bacterium]
MKKLITRTLCAILMLAMLVPMIGIMASAAEIKNLYVVADAQLGTPPTTNVNDAASGNRLYWTSAPIAVKAGDVVTFGPMLSGQGYFITTYDESGAVKIAKVAYADCTVVDTVNANAQIVKWTVTEGTAFVRVVNSQIFKDSTMVTINQEFTAADYFAEMDKNNINVDYVRPTTAKELVNLFPTSDKTFFGRSDKSKGEVAADNYRTSDYIPVKGGDVLYIAAAATSQTYQITMYGAEKKAITNVNTPYFVQYADLGDGKAVLAYSMPHDIEYVRVVISTPVYDAGKQLVTLNQPFDAEGYNNYFNPPAETEPETTKPAEPVPTGDSSLVFAAIAIISLVGVATIAKRREN